MIKWHREAQDYLPHPNCPNIKAMIPGGQASVRYDAAHGRFLVYIQHVAPISMQHRMFVPLSDDVPVTKIYAYAKKLAMAFIKLRITPPPVS